MANITKSHVTRSHITSFIVFMILLSNIATFANCDDFVNKTENGISVSDIQWKDCHTSRTPLFDIENIDISLQKIRLGMKVNFDIKVKTNGTSVIRKPYADVRVKFKHIHITRFLGTLCKFTQCPIRANNVKLSGSGKVSEIFTTDYYKATTHLYSKHPGKLGCVKIFVKFSKN